MDRLNTSHGEQWTHSFLQGQSRKLAHSSHVQLNGTEYYLETELGDVLNHDFSVMQDKKEKGTLTRLLQLLSIQMVEYCVLIVMRNATIEWIILQCCVSMLLGSSSFVFKLFSLNNRMISASDILLMSTCLPSPLAKQVLHRILRRTEQRRMHNHPFCSKHQAAEIDHHIPVIVRKRGC